MQSGESSSESTKKFSWKSFKAKLKAGSKINLTMKKQSSPVSLQQAACLSSLEE